MLESCDVGSLPFVGDFQKYVTGAVDYGKIVDDSTLFFEQKVVDAVIDKAATGIDVPNYPQYRDMVQMFLGMFEGVQKVNGGYIETETLRLKQEKTTIPEVLSIKNRSRDISEKLGKPFKLRICITGPYTMSSVFAFKDRGTFTRLGRVLAQMVETNVFDTKEGKVKLVSIDEPLFGLVDDPLLDRSSEGRQNLLEAWESIMKKIKAKNAQSCLHLHNTSDELFWDLRSLDIIESHVDDGFYLAKRTKEKLEKTDKSVKASIAKTDFDELIIQHLVKQTTSKQLSESVLNEKVADVWKGLSHGKTNPLMFIEGVELMRTRLNAIVERFGANRVKYSGTECGLRSFPTYQSAIECLKRVSQASGNFSTVRS